MNQQKISASNQAQHDVICPYGGRHAKKDQIRQWHGSRNPCNHKRFAMAQVKPVAISQRERIRRTPAIQQAVAHVDAPRAQCQCKEGRRWKSQAESRGEKPTPCNSDRRRVETEQMPPDPRRTCWTSMRTPLRAGSRDDRCAGCVTG
mgnify:CR=1 FL=1